MCRELGFSVEHEEGSGDIMKVVLDLNGATSPAR
jgi:hypothetical protein